MTIKGFKALVVEETEGNITARVKECDLSNLSEGNTLIKTAYSAVNFKDGLATIKNGGVVRSYPMIPGVDAVGEVVTCEDGTFEVGDLVILTGNAFGVSHTGGFSEYIRVPSQWPLKLPKELTLREGAIVGTAGLTAVEAINQLEKHGLAEKNTRILVTGATGGVGSTAIAMLKSLGYQNITALSRKKNEDYLLEIGASCVIGLEEFIPEKIKPLQKQHFDYVIDTIGGETLSAILPQISYGGSIALCGNASGINFSTTVLPFILRGVTMIGIDSVQLSNKVKRAIWEKVAQNLDKELIDKIGRKEKTLDEMEEVISGLLKGTHSGRTIIKF
ncbi:MULTISPECIES: acryloyl-CoA reductase [Vagococcus]|uniref:Alcohol dehydrogenase n=1 Tax=Vagococcus fluvialis bH819 TaxID=1255619 RepID=A0A1X6WL91_9ENTE|nr:MULTISPECIES: acryloyl-CoA reductase [Vagococcus]SLM85035.1 Alcohol dehydrogenase [Vagococcus fluvialis bH819]HCM88549.1 NADPH:quinone reductase [Vagococcus sp.]